MIGEVVSSQLSVGSGGALHGDGSGEALPDAIVDADGICRTMMEGDALSEMGREAAAGADALLQAARVKTMATPEKVAVFVDCLRGRGWLTARAIEAESGLGDRLLRALAEASDGEIISGQLGYRLTCEATLAELDAAEGWLRSQAKKMTARAVQIRVARNRRRLHREDLEGAKELLNSERREVFPDAPLRPI